MKYQLITHRWWFLSLLTIWFSGTVYLFYGTLGSWISASIIGGELEFVDLSHEYHFVQFVGRHQTLFLLSGFPATILTAPGHSFVPFDINKGIWHWNKLYPFLLVCMSLSVGSIALAYFLARRFRKSL